MRAAIIKRFGNPEVFEVKDTEKPVIKEDEVLIQVISSSINPVEWKHRIGNHKFLLGSGFPIILGYDVSGSIVDIGNKVTKYKIGDRVNARLTNKYGGAYAELAKASIKTISKIPDGIDFYTAAALPLAGITALQGLRDYGKIKEGQKVLINGAASGVGHIALQLAKYYKTEVTAVCSSKHKVMMDDLKPDYSFDYNTSNIKSINSKFDIIFDVVGTESFLSLRHLLNKNGIYITTLPRPKIMLHKIIALFTKGLKVKTFLMKSIGKDLDFLNQLIKEKRLKIYIDKTFSLNKISEAHSYSELGKTEGKIVIKIGN